MVLLILESRPLEAFVPIPALSEAVDRAGDVAR